MGEYEPNDSRNVTGAGTGEQAGGQGQPQQFQRAPGQMGGGADTGGTLRDRIREHMEVIGADGAHLGTVDAIEGDRIKLTRDDSGMSGHRGHHHFLPLGLVAGIEGNRVRLSANADTAYGMEEEE